MVSLAIFAVEVWTAPGPGLYNEMVLGSESHKNMTSEQTGQPWDIQFSPIRRKAEVEALLNGKTTELASPVETVSIQLDRNIQIQSQPFISNLPGSQELGKPSFLQVQYNFPLGLAFLAKESHHCDFQK